jgi:threonine/homoserine/homoserine lactone efflux protein
MFPWVSFLIYVVIAAFVPGASNIMAMNNARSAGFKKGMVFNLGIFTGFFVGIILCLVFSALLYTIVPKVQLPMKILGAAYMVFLIVKIVVPSKEQKVKRTGGSFIIGALLPLVNPLGIVFGLTMSTYILPHYKEIPQLLFFAFLIAFVGFTGALCWALFGSLFSVLFNRHRKLLNMIMAALLLYCAVSLFL